MGTYGASAPGSHTINYDALLSTTLMNLKPVMFDNIFKSSAYLAAMREYGGVEKLNGGVAIERVLMYEENETFASYEGYDIIDTTPQDGITRATYRWAEIGGSITISRREERQNSGEAAMLNLFKQKTEQAEMSAKSILNKQSLQGTVSSTTFVPGNDAKDVLPLGYFLRKDPATDPTAGGNVGNLSGSTYDWWRHRSANLGGSAASDDTFGLTVSTYAGLRVGLYRLYNHCSRGADGSGPNICLADQTTFETYENSLDQLKRYGMDDKLASMGFDTVKLKGATMIWDELVPDLESGTTALTYGTAFMLNTRFFKLFIDEETDFETTPFIQNQNQTAKVAKVLFMGNQACSNLRKLGAARKISLSIAS